MICFCKDPYNYVDPRYLFVKTDSRLSDGNADFPNEWGYVLIYAMALLSLDCSYLKSHESLRLEYPLLGMKVSLIYLHSCSLCLLIHGGVVVNQRTLMSEPGL